MILVFVTTKSNKELMTIAPIVNRNLEADGHGHDGICFIKVSEPPLILAEGKMAWVEKTHIFIIGLDIESQGKELRLEERISAETGLKTSIL